MAVTLSWTFWLHFCTAGGTATRCPSLDFGLKALCCSLQNLAIYQSGSDVTLCLVQIPERYGNANLNRCSTPLNHESVCLVQPAINNWMTNLVGLSSGPVKVRLYTYCCLKVKKLTLYSVLLEAFY